MSPSLHFYLNGQETRGENSNVSLNEWIRLYTRVKVRGAKTTTSRAKTGQMTWRNLLVEGEKLAWMPEHTS